MIGTLGRYGGWLAIGVLALALAPPAARAQEAPTTADLLSHRAAITLGDSGYTALPLPAEVLAIAAPDLSDVRIVASDGALVPYAVTWAERDVDRLPPELETFELEPTNARQSQAIVGGVRVATETYEVLVPPRAWREHAELELSTSRIGFTATVRVTSADGAELARGSIFSLPAISAERSTLDLPARVEGAVRIEIRSEPAALGAGAPPPAGASAVFLTPRITLHQRSVEPRVPSVEQVLERLAARTEAGTQILELARPPGTLPIALRIETTSSTFASAVRVEAVGGDGTRREVGSGRILRVTPSDPALAFSELSIAIHAADVSGDRLVVSLERGDSPPLEGVTVIASMRQPSLLFDTYAAGGAATLAFGGARLRAPDYDVAWLAGNVARGAGTGSLGAVERNPAYHAEPALAFAMRAGAAVERARFSAAAPLSIADAREGLTRVLLSPALVAVARPDGGDLRVVGADDRQWPYVLAGSAREEWVELAVSAVEPAPDRDRTTRYVLLPSVASVTADEIEITFDDTFYSRSVELFARERPDVADERGILVAQGALASNERGTPARLSLSSARARALELFVEDGDEAPLSIARVRARLTLQDLLVTAPAGEYEVLAGDPTLTSPAYDLSRADASLLENVPVLEVPLGEVRANPAYRAPSMFERAGWEAAVLYGVLALAVLVLGLITLRLARTEPAVAPASPAPRSGAPGSPSPETPASGDAPGDGEDEAGQGAEDEAEDE